MAAWLGRPKPVPFNPRPIMIDTPPITLRDYVPSNYRATGIVFPMRYRPISFTSESPNLSSRDANVKLGETFVTRYEPSLRSKQNGD